LGGDRLGRNWEGRQKPRGGREKAAPGGDRAESRALSREGGWALMWGWAGMPHTRACRSLGRLSRSLGEDCG
jgi:hypothetical protein